MARKLGASGRPHEIAVINSRCQRQTYSVSLIDVRPTSSNYVLCALNSGSDGIIHIRRVVLLNPGNATAAYKLVLDMVRLNAATTVGGGAAYTPNAYDPGDSAFSGTCFTATQAGAGQPTISATGQSIAILSAFVPATNSANFVPFGIDWNGEMGSKSPTVPYSTANAGGIAIRAVNGAAGQQQLDLLIEFTEEEF